MRGREKEREMRERALEKKARQQADQGEFFFWYGIKNEGCVHNVFFD